MHENRDLGKIVTLAGAVSKGAAIAAQEPRAIRAEVGF
jgi:hypothetical protein